ncbi:MAG TPA: hypothetical protein VJB57_00460 [Dehalococcoidia bacterium]|nr:hypothetical protein [Dehalococcoidia bacterium]
MSQLWKLAIVLVAAVILTLACSSDKKPAPSQAAAALPQTTATVAAQPTLAPASTPGPAPTETPAPPPTPPPPTPAAAAPSAAPRPATPPSISLSPNPVTVNGVVTVTGRGFLPNSQVTITGTSGPLMLPLGTATADAQGSFVDSDRVPSSVPPGTYTVIAVDSARNSATSQMTITR